MAMSEGGQASRVARSAVDTTRRGSNASPVARHAIVGLSAAFAVMLVSGATATGSGLETVGLLAASRPVAFVPLGDFPRSDAMSLARHYERTLGLETRVLPRSDIPKSAFNQARKQYVAEKLIDVVASRRNAGNARDVLVGLTTRDMHTRDIPNWRFTFSIRHPSGLAVVSRARMDPRLLGLSPDPVLRMRRLRKMVLKNIGLLALGLSQSQDPRSALYDVILSTDDLDYMTEELKPRTPSRAKRAWLLAARTALANAELWRARRCSRARRSQRRPMCSRSDARASFSRNARGRDWLALRFPLRIGVRSRRCSRSSSAASTPIGRL